MRTTKTISRLVDLFVDNTDINNWSKLDWKLQISKEIDELVKEAKSEGWDEGYKAGADYQQDLENFRSKPAQIRRNENAPRVPTNPFKQ